MDILNKICDCIVNMQDDLIENLVLESVNDENISIEDIYEKGLNKGMIMALDKFEKKEYYLPEVIVCADTLNKGISMLSSYGDINSKPKAVIVLAVVEGDTHEIGKNIVKIMMKASGYKVIDMGVNAKCEDIINTALNEKADIIALSSMMTTTMQEMRVVINNLNDINIDKKPKVIIGGGPVSKKYADEIGANGYSENAPKAVKLLERLLEEA